MKRLIPIILFLFPSLAFADGMVVKVGSSPSTDSCTSGLLFSWHCENTDVTLGGIGGGVNNGCSAGDTTATANSSAAINGDVSAQDGVYSCDYPTSSDYYYFTVSSDDIAKDEAGTVIFYLYINSYVDNTILFRLIYNATSNLYVWMNVSGGYNRLELTYNGNGTAQTKSTTNTANITTGTWHKVTAKWSTVAVGGKYLHIDIDDGDIGEGSSALTGFEATPTQLRIGNDSANSGDFAIDNVKIYDSWL